MALIDEGSLDGDGASVEALAERLGVGERQLRRLFVKHLGASPVAVAQTRRVLFAKQLLHDTRMPVEEIAAAAGFGSLRRMHEVFQEIFRRPPNAIRRAATTDVVAAAEGVTLRVRYRPPYGWDAMLRWLAAHAVQGLDAVEEDVYLRSIRLHGKRGRIRVSHDAKRQSLLVRMEFPEVRSYPAILARVRRMFDTDADILHIEEHLCVDPLMRRLVKKRPGTRAPGMWESPETMTVQSSDEFPQVNAVLLRAVSRLDPALNTSAALLRRAEAWRPWRAYAAQHLWCVEGDR